MSFLAAGWALSGTWALGALALSAAGLFPRGGWHRVLAGFGAGAFLIGLIGTVLVTLDLPLSVMAVYAVGVLLAIPVGLQWWSGPRDRIAIDFGWRVSLDRQELLWRSLAIAAVVMVGLILVASTQDRLWWDGWAIWGFKAKVLFLESGLPAPLRDPSGPYGFTHLDYPLGLPLLGWWLYEHAGAVDAALLSTLGAVLFALTVAGVWVALRARTDRRIAAAATLGTAGFWPVSYYAIGGTADIVMALALVGVTVETRRFLDGQDAAAVWRAGIFLGLAALTKNEGMALSLGALVIVAWWSLRSKRGVTAVLAMLIPLLSLAPWLAFRLSHGLTGDQLSMPTVTTLVERTPGLLRGLGVLVTSVEWVALPFLAAIGVAAALKGRKPGQQAAWALLGAYFAAACVAYLVSPREIVWLLVTSLPRVLGAMVPMTVLLTVLAVFPKVGAQPGSRRAEPVPTGVESS